MNDAGFAAFLQNHENLKRFSARYRGDAAVRDRIAGGDYSDLDFEVPPGVEVRVTLETADTYYCPMPPDPNAQLADQALAGVAGGRGGTHVSSAATASTIPSCLGSASSISSVEIDSSGNVL